ncbi:MAG: LamG-like jellyroll fold domain-containing protein, partial [Bacteroidia bacterium]
NCSVPAYVPTNGLVGYWPFCGNANDVSGNGNNGTVNGATLTTDRNGNASEAYSFDGVDDFIDLFNTDAYSSFSLSYWFNADTLQDYTSQNIGQKILSKISNNQSFPNGWESEIDIDGNINFGNGQQNILGQSVNGVNSWNFVVFTYDIAGQILRQYENGQLVATISGFNIIANGKDIRIGARSVSPSLFHFKGKIDDVSIWNRSLVQQEISQMFVGGCTKPEPVSLGTSASTRLCPSESVTIEIVSPADSANYTYQWTRNGTNMIGATTRSITVNDAAKYKVFVSSGPGVDCRRVSGLVETTPSIPPAVTATAPNGTSYCPGDSVLMTATGATAGYSYRWKRFGVVIPGANSNTFYATQTGNYRCEIYNAGGCITQSNLISITNGTSCRIMEQTNSDVSVYPNPAENAFTVSFNDIGNETPVSVSLRSLQGQVIEQRNIAGKEDVQFAVNKLAPGLYVVIIQLESGDSIEKTVVVE